MPYPRLEKMFEIAGMRGLVPTTVQSGRTHSRADGMTGSPLVEYVRCTIAYVRCTIRSVITIIYSYVGVGVG